MKFTSIIDAIKAVRSIPVLLEVIINDRGEKVIAPRISLKDSKDMVEAIMEYGKNHGSIELTSLRAENVRLNDKVNHLNQKLGMIRDITYPDYPRNDYRDEPQF